MEAIALDTFPTFADHPTSQQNSPPGWVELTSEMRATVNATDWTQWKHYLTRRDTVRPLQSLVSGKKSAPLSWALYPDDVIDTRTLPLLEKLGPIASGRSKPAKSIAADLESWLSDVDRRIAERNLVLELIAWAHALPRLTEPLGEQRWWSCLTKLMDHAQDAVAATFENKIYAQGLAGELPLTLAYQFPEIIACRNLVESACRTIAEAMEALTDGEGLLKAHQIRHLRALLASWTRSLAMINAAHFCSLPDDAVLQFQWLVRQALRLTRADGTQTLSQGLAGVYSKHLFQTALEISGDEEDELIARLCLPKGKGKSSAWHLPLPSYESAWSQVAYLRTTWDQQAPRVAIRHDKEALVVELESRGDLLLSGTWNTTITVDGHVLARKGAWEQVGWQADDDGDYLELEQLWSEGARLQRLLFLAREDQFLWAMDSLVLEHEADKIELKNSLPITASGTVEEAEETCDLLMKLPHSEATLLPVGINEWRTDSQRGRLAVTGDRLELRQFGRGRGVVAPLFIDLSRKRQHKPLTWRQLTVAEKLEIQPLDKAVAYRVQIGKGHWIFYRSLTPKANRTFLGVNLVAESLVARLDEEGNIEKLLEVEAT